MPGAPSSVLVTSSEPVVVGLSFRLQKDDGSPGGATGTKRN